MAEKNEIFFIEKKEWSKTKDALLGCYLRPYFSKILHTKKPIIYVDCFAGKGFFDDGEKGSPLIALDIIHKTLGITNSDNEHPVEKYFIELNHHEDLKRNLNYDKTAVVIGGRYEENILNILSNKNNYCIFLYIDPYGFKALDYEIFREISNKRNYSLEIFINFNSFGFFRQACNVLGTDLREKDMMEELPEYEASVFTKSEEAKLQLNSIAGGDYWIKIVESYNNEIISSSNAEKMIAKGYQNQLKKLFKYVVNMPIRLNEENHPKYRMIFATNHSSGANIMIRNMLKRKNELTMQENNGQLSFFELDMENNLFDREKTKVKIFDMLNSLSRETLTDFIAKFYTSHEILCDLETFTYLLKELEHEGKIIIDRDPKFTSNGKISSFWTEDSKHKVFLKKRND